MSATEAREQERRDLSVKIVMTLMVRDEADIIAAMIEHHLSQGVDLIIATDNGSVDGTREILADYARAGRVELHDYLTQDKNQTAVVSGMASRAATVHGADWVINADADEFFVTRDPALNLRSALTMISPALGSFSVPVRNLTGTPARRGSGLRRLVWQDHRDEETLMERYALHAHPSPDVIHIGRADVVVQQGNHGVNIPSQGQPSDAHAIEVLHLPWRSFEQYASKIENTGRSYDANPGLNPSPRHHGMRDYRFFKAGFLEDMYIMRHPGADPGPEFVHDSRILDHLESLLRGDRAVCADRLSPLLRDDDSPYSADRIARSAEVARVLIPLEMEHIEASTRWRDLYREEARARRVAEEKASSTISAREAIRNAVERRVRGADRIFARAARRGRRNLPS